MKKNLLQEVKAMNKVAGTQMTKEQEINFIRERLNELEFDSQKELDAYKKSHKVRPGTQLKLAPLATRAGHAIKKGAAKVGDKISNTVGKALYTTKVGNAAMKGLNHGLNKIGTKLLGLSTMTDKKSDKEIDARKDYYKKK